MAEPAAKPAAHIETQQPFAAEVGRLLDLVVHALYSNREIFLRELVANAADAIDRRRFLSLTDSALALPPNAAVRIRTDHSARKLVIADDGIGMDREDLARELGTIARSGTLAFGEKLVAAKPEDRPSLIGQFGVGFYSAFMVAEEVEVISRRAGTEQAWRWHSTGTEGFAITPAERERAGTDVILTLKADAAEFLDPVRIDGIVRKWADHIDSPVLIVRDGKEVAANEGTALWRKPRSEVTEQERTAFYRHLGNLFDSPWTSLHWRAEGTLDFAALLFVPGTRYPDPLEGERRSRVRLHVKRMFITDEAELLPPWLRFVQGVVDTEDLPLNVSREMLQSTPVLARLRKVLTQRVLAELQTRAADSADYESFWNAFGAILKEGVWEDSPHRAEIAPLLRFHSTLVDGLTSLSDYSSRMKPDQPAIYVHAAESVEAGRASPLLEAFRAKGYEVLLGADPIDAFWPDRLAEFKDRPIRRAFAAVGDLGPLPAAEADIVPLLAAIKSALGDRVAEVRASARLTDSAVLLSPPEQVPDWQMQRLLRRAGRKLPDFKPVIEINPHHALIRALAARAHNGEGIKEQAEILFALAALQEGETLPDPAGFARRVLKALEEVGAARVA